MSEAILKALMQLFALISDIHDDTIITAREKKIVRIFLIRHLNDELVERYMAKFEEYLGTFNSERIIKGSIQDRKRISLNSMRILAICEKINEELRQRQKIYVIIKLTDYIFSGSEITETELDFLQTVADAFNIPATEFCNIRSFIMENAGAMCERNKLLIINNNEAGSNDGTKHLCNRNLKGTIMFLNILSTNSWLMRYTGSEDLSLNGQNIIEGETYVFEHGSSIRGAGIKAIYYSEIVSQISEVFSKSAVYLEASDVSFIFRNSNNGVHDLNFNARSGELAGILGGSGVGKSTTLSILSGTLKPKQGKVLINGYDLYVDEDREKLSGVIGFVPQDDLLIEDLTVYQNLYYNARMCLSNLSEAKLEVAVNKILIDLDLYDARDLRVGNPLKKIISGGQRKRINIALELMREPTILFVDEPTSGLSSIDSEMVMSLLKDLSYKGKLVIVNIHQPSSEIYKMFDKIMIIDRGGFQIFYGNPTEAITYFKVQANLANPDEDQCPKCGNVDAEQILQIIESKVIDEHGKATRLRKVTPAEWALRFRAFSTRGKNNAQPTKQSLPENSFSIPGLYKQSVIFFTRDLLSKIADKQYVLISLLGPPLLALLLSYFTKSAAGDNYSFRENENIPAYLFMCVITSMFFGLMGSSEEIVSDRKILKRESFLNLSWFSYLNSKILIMFLLSAVQTFLFVVIGNRILEIRSMTVSYWLVLFSTSCFGNILGLNLSAAFRSVLTIYILIPFIIIPQLLFSGVIVKFDKLNTSQHQYVPLIGELMMARWSFEAIAVEQFGNNDYEKLFFKYDADISRDDWYSGFLIQDLKVKVQFNRRFRDSIEHRERIRSNFGKLSYNIENLAALTGREIPVALHSSLRSMKLDTITEKQAITLLDSIRSDFLGKRNAAKAGKNALISKLERENSNEWLVNLRNNFENKRLTTLMLAEEERDKLIETEDLIIPKLDPGFMKAKSPYGRAHFFAPVKMLGNREINTFMFNLFFIWSVILILYLALYFRLLEKMITLIINMKLKVAE
jgi:ABC transport system ATP-binding/permease protein